MTIFLILLYCIFFAIFSLFALPITWFIGLFSPKLKEEMSYAIGLWCIKTTLKLSMVPVRYIGLENIPKDEACMFVGNHQGSFDILSTYPCFPKKSIFISKIEFSRVPIMAQWMRRIHCLFMDRDDLKQSLKVILEAIDLIKKGYSIAIFPEGTRNKESEDLLPFKEGSFKIAQKTGCPIVPMAMTNMASVFERQLPWIVREEVIVEFGKPVYIDTLSKEDQKHLGQYMRELIIEMKSHHKLNQ